MADDTPTADEVSDLTEEAINKLQLIRELAIELENVDLLFELGELQQTIVNLRKATSDSKQESEQESKDTE